MLFRSNDTATTEIYTQFDTLSLHDALPSSRSLSKASASANVTLSNPFSFAFSAALGTNAKETGAGKALIEFLRTPEAVGVIRAKGMEPVAP